MRFLLRCIALFLLLLKVCASTHAQGTSNKGTEFYTAYMDHNNGSGTSGTQSSMNLYITSDVSTTGVVELADGSSPQPFTVTANQVTTVLVPYSAFLGNLSGKAPSSKGIHITAQRPVAVYAHIFANSVSGATLLLPVNTLGKDYTSINYTQKSNAALNNPAYNSFIIVATDDNTSVQVTPSATLISGEVAGQSFTLALNKGEVFQGLSADGTDLTGTHIKSVSANGVACKKIAVFSGSSRIYIGNCTAKTSDNLFQQVYPTSSWGKNYISAPLSSRNFDVFRVVLSDPATVLKINGNLIPATSFTSAGYYEFTSKTPNVFTADKPIQVVQYAVTQGTSLTCATISDIGDPEMIYLNPIEQGLDHVTLYSCPRYSITASYINVIIPSTAASTFKVDGAAYTNFINLANSTYAYAQIKVANGTHNITAGANFNAIAYGFGSVESYGYSAGTDLKNLAEQITVTDSTTKQVLTSTACSDQRYKLQLTLPYKTSQIKWDFKDSTAAVYQNNPVSKDTVINDNPAYIYSYTGAVNFKKGSHAVVATVFKPGADDCGSNVDIEFDFNVVDPPPISFAINNFCLGQGTAFTYSSVVDSTVTNTYDWDFGDGSLHGTEQNPVHTYATSGDYKVVLSVTSSTGCSNVSAPQAVHISKKPKADFSYSSPDCNNVSIAFKDASVDPEGNKIISWNWNFGDGSTSTDQNPVHTYAKDSTYLVKLVVANDKACQGDTTTKNLVIHPTPVADFTAPDICLNDGKEQFTNTSDFKGDPQTGFAYQWTFGDKFATAANNASTAKDPQHAYTKAGTYTVTLVITSPFGCISSVATKDIIVNASTPTAAFAVNNSTMLCTANPVIFQDKSTKSTDDVITKVVWHWGDSSADSVFPKDSIHTNGQYRHLYTFAATTPTAKTYTVTLDEYTGLTCISTTTQTITVNANPVITLTPPVSVCQEASPVIIPADQHGFIGNGVFSGDGISAGGIFSPYKAGPGKHTINYVFTTNTSECTYSQTFDIVVNATPVLTMPADFKLLEGDTTTLKPTAVGDSLTYQWTPSAGLDHDNVLSPLASPTNDTRYTLTATSAKGCSVSASVFITVLKVPKVSNTFTPNGDGVNDTWHIDQLDRYVNSTVEVFSRNGEKVFSSLGYSVPWDGKYNGQDLPAGVYYYIINPKSGRKTMSGWVTVVR
ncbi:gliding motility-associated C-terminal domain-containing protein [Mucilaginibacter ginkgonis]|uniref:PKD domain-containing protein n=1 Tax=Mucilaginibacter ginkgonis TaxID=2682091 RepID=A0A6I4I474_9SPHI|nr:PKD domain-containing protein [Mucilaginibacter ginkgonis]QQL50607.1 PKD domain-containing protein [Mucilaginibacter ginkgonis]